MNAPTHHTSRSLHRQTIPEGEATVATIVRTYPTDPQDLWDAITSPERLPRWFMPISGDLQEGGHYQLEGNAGGTITACEPPRTFSVTWEYGDQLSWLTVSVGDHAAGAQLTVAHTGIIPDEVWAQFGPSATGIGWDLGLHGLGLHVADGSSPADPETAQKWQTSQEAMDLMLASADAWCAADIAFGTDPEQARAAADRTVAFYTGQDSTADQGDASE